MATASGTSTPGVSASGMTGGSVSDRTLEGWLYQEGYGFDFFQAVRVLEKLEGDRSLVGGPNDPAAEIVRFRARVALEFPPSAIYEVQKSKPDFPVALMTVAFLGMHGPSGVLPRHYTELLL